jgi:tRNA 2-thiouridine synthesizing protein B
MLHIINKSSFERNNLQTAVNFVDDNSVVLLTEDGVISATTNTKSDLIADLAGSGRVYALQGDVDARGLSTKVASGVKLVDYEGFVDLVVEHGTPVSWV